MVKYYTENKTPDLTDRNLTRLFNISESNIKDIHNLYMGLSFVRGIQVGNQVYFYDTNGNINKHNSIFVDPNKTDINNYLNLFKEKGLLSMDEKINTSNIIFNIIEYTEDNWSYLNNLKSKLHDILESINELFVSSKTEIGLPDKSFNQVNNPNVKLLND